MLGVTVARPQLHPWLPNFTSSSMAAVEQTRKGRKEEEGGKGKKEVRWLRKINDEVDDEYGDAEDF